MSIAPGSMRGWRPRAPTHEEGDFGVASLPVFAGLNDIR